MTTIPLATLLGRIDRADRWALCVAAFSLGILLVARSKPELLVPLIAIASAAIMVINSNEEGSLKIILIWSSSLFLWAIGTGAVGLATGRLRSGEALAPALVGLALADVAMLIGSGLRIPAALIMFTLAVAAACWAQPERSLALGDPVRARFRLERIELAIDRCAAAIGRAVVVVLMLPVLAMMVVAWLVYRVTGLDPLASPTAIRGGWVERFGHDETPNRYYGTVAIADRRTVRARLARVAATGCTIAILVGMLVVISTATNGDEPTGTAIAPPNAVAPTTMSGEVATSAPVPVDPASCPEPPDPPAMDRQADWALIKCETDTAGSRGEFYGPAVYRLADFHGETINMTAGVRKTWTPPVCGCRRLRVWVFGGSAAWGFYQRDRYTFPSQLARVAAEQGLTLDVTNYAMPGYMIGQEARTFADRTTTEAPPDMVIFYDGFNDVAIQGLRATVGRIDDESEGTILESAVNDVFKTGIALTPSKELRLTPVPLTIEPTDVEIARAPAVGRHALNRYTRNVGLIERLAASIGAEAVVVFQPDASGSPEAAGPGAISDLQRTAVGSAMEVVRNGLPARVIDLGDAFHDVEEPVFVDIAHTNEDGARIAAEDLIERILPRLQKLAE